MFKAPLFLFVLLLSVCIFSQTAEPAPAPAPAPQPVAKATGVVQKSIDSVLAIFNNQLLGELPENTTAAVTKFEIKGSVVKRVTVFDTLTKKPVTTDSTVLMTIEGKIFSTYTKNGEKRQEIIDIIDVHIDKTRPAKKPVAASATPAAKPDGK
jgi:hypothetical protein